MATNGTLSLKPMKATSNGLFQGDNPLDYALPLLILQIVIVISLTRVLALLLRFLRQPRVIAEIIGGILLGPSALGRNKDYLHTIFPPKSLTVLDTLANMGLLFFLFLVGLELDLKAIKRTGKTALAIAVAGITLPFAMGIGTSFALRATISKGVKGPPFLVFMGVALSITAFPVLARILAELKLLTTDVGRMAMSAAAVNDVAAWVLLALAIALSSDNGSPLISLYVFLTGAAFIAFCWFFAPMAFRWMSRRCPEGEPVKEIYICVTLAIVLAAGFVTDMIGIHALFGAFVIGVLVPKEGPFAGALVEKVEDLVSGLFLPLYFVSSGLKTDVATIRGAQSWGLLALVITTACFGKIFGTVGVSLLCKMPLRESLALGFLMNTKGLVELIVLNIGKDRKVLNDQTFAIMVLMAIFTTFITTPIVTALYNPAKRRKFGDPRDGSGYEDRSLRGKNDNSSNNELRILACFHGIRNVPTMINLIEASRGTGRKERLCVYAMHLMELTERTSAIRMVHKARKNGLPFWNRSALSDPDQIVVAFEAFEQLSSVSLRPMTAISAVSGMHEDICRSAEEKRAAMILLPFHRHHRLDGSIEPGSTPASAGIPEFRGVNRRVLEKAPCSVAILVDRGLGGPTHVSARNVSYQISVVFFGGRDDREALALGSRMAEHPGIALTVLRLVVDESETEDEDAISELKAKMSENDSIKYEEKAKIEVDSIKELSKCHLFVVGRTPRGNLSELLRVKNDYPELGPIGNLLISLEFSTSASVLIVQQHHISSIPNPPSQPNSAKVENDNDLEANK